MTNKRGPEPTPKNPRQRVWLAIPDILDELGIDRGTFDHWRRRGVAPKMIQLPNRTWRIRGDWYDEWLDQLPDTDGRWQHEPPTSLAPERHARTRQPSQGVPPEPAWAGLPGEGHRPPARRSR